MYIGIIHICICIYVGPCVCIYIYMYVCIDVALVKNSSNAATKVTSGRQRRTLALYVYIYTHIYIVYLSMAQWRKNISNDPKWMVTYSNGQILWVHSNPNSEPKSFGNSVKLNCEGLARKWVRLRIEGSSTRNQQNPKASGLWFLTHTQQGICYRHSVPRWRWKPSGLAMNFWSGMIWWFLELLAMALKNGHHTSLGSPYDPQKTTFLLGKSPSYPHHSGRSCQLWSLSEGHAICERECRGDGSKVWLEHLNGDRVYSETVKLSRQAGVPQDQWRRMMMYRLGRLRKIIEHPHFSQRPGEWM